MFNFYIYILYFYIKVVLKGGGGSGILPQKILYGNRYKFGLF